MTQLGEATIPIRATLDKLDSDLGNARGMVEHAIGGIGRVAAVGLGAGVAAGAALTAAFGAVVVPATQAAARTSELDAVLGLLGQRAGWSTGQVRENTQAMRDLGIRTDVAQGLLAQFARYQLDAADATRIARVAQDAAVLSMQDSSEALDQIMHGILTQNSMVLRNAGLNIQAGQALDVYAESLGKTATELTEVERIQAIMNAVMAEGERIAGTYETAMEEPGKAVRSLSRHFYEAQVAIGEHFLPAMGKVVDFATEFIKGVRRMLEEGQPLGTFFEETGRLAGNLLDTIGTLADLIAPGLGLGDLAGALDVVNGPLGRINDFLETFNSRIALGWEPIDALTSAVLALTGSAETAHDFREKLQGILDTIEWLKNASLQDILLEIFPPETVAGILTVFEVAKQAVGAFVDVIVQDVWPLLKQAFEEIGAAFSQLGVTWEDVGAVLTAVGMVLLAVVGVIAGVITGLANAMVAMGQSWQRVFANIQFWIQGWVTFFTNAVAAAKALFAGDLPGALEHARLAVQGLVQAFVQTWLIIANTVRGAVEIVIALVAGLVGGIIGFFTNLHQRLVGGSIIPEMLAAILAAFTTKLAEVLTVISTWINDALTFLRGTISQFAQVGRDMMDGLRRGILEAAARMIAALSDVVAGAMGVVRRLLGIGSPSRWAIEVAENVMSSMGKGLRDSADLAVNAMRAATGEMMAASTVTVPAMAAVGAGGGARPLAVEAVIVLDGREIGRGAWRGTLEAAAADGIRLEALVGS